MATPSSGAISANNIRTEFGLSGPLSFGNLYRGGSTIRNNFGNNSGVPANGALDFSDYYNLYKDGTIAQKIAAWESYRTTGLHSQKLESGVVKITHTNDYYSNSYMAGPGGTQVVTNNYTTERSSMIAPSEWTTIIGVAGCGLASGGTISSSHTQYNHYNDNHNGNANVATAQINLPFTELGNISYSFNRAANARWAAGMLILMPGKWEVNRDYTAQGSGWGYNTLGIGNNAPSISFLSNEFAVHGRERNGNGPSSGGITGTNVSKVSINGWWYNTGNAAISWPTGASSSASPYMYNEQPDGTWIFREVS